MAKKKSTRKKNTKDVKPEHELPGGFWRQVFALLMIAIAIVLVMTWFGGGGEILKEIHPIVMKGIGLATYAIPVLLVYLAVRIFRSDTNQIPVVVWFASLIMIVWLAGLAGLPTIGQTELSGGIVGEWLNGLITKILNPYVAAFIYAVLIFITIIFMLQVSPKKAVKDVANALNPSKRRKEVAEDNVNQAIKKGNLAIKVNSGVAMVESKEEKVTAGKKAPVAASTSEPERALVAISDPDWKMPSTELLSKRQSPADAGNVQQNAMIIKNTFSEFGIEVEMEDVNLGPRVAQYTMRPPQGVNLSKITALDKELALNLAVDSGIRIEAPIPGTRLVGVEVPNTRAADVSLRSILESKEWKNDEKPLTFAVGKDISGHAITANLAKMPHLLVAGTTGSGKSVMTNTLITSLLYRNAPSDLRLIIVDPKQVEMVQYNDIPHLLTPIITTTEKSLSAMKWAVNEMERRYSLMAEEKVKNIVDYNEKMAKNSATTTVKDADGNDQEHNGGKMPYIVIVVDEMADLMMTAGKDLEFLIVRIAQKGRAAGMHLVLATQRPEAKVITGLIKANIPGRIAFAVQNQIDSRIMIDQVGAEKLLGMGDMLLLTTEMMGKPLRIQGAWSSDDDVMKVTNFLREQRPPDYNDEILAQPVQLKGGVSMSMDDGLGRKFDPDDPVVRKAVEITISKGKFATSMLQAHLGKGYGFVNGLAMWLEEIGAIGPVNGTKPRDVLISSMEEFDELANS